MGEGALGPSTQLPVKERQIAERPMGGSDESEHIRACAPPLLESFRREAVWRDGSGKSGYLPEQTCVQTKAYVKTQAWTPG